jgi:hypothetical protein
VSTKWGQLHIEASASPGADVRRCGRCSTLRSEFLKLLAAEESEQIYQTFLEENTRLIPREFIQNHGIHFQLVLRKLALAKDYVTDFFYLAKSSGDWNCVLIEIEKPQSRYFKVGTNELHEDFLQALDQIDRWRAWFDTGRNHDGFVNGTILPLRIPVPLRENPSFIKYVLVFGRRTEFADSDQRRSLIRAKERDDFKIVSYDSLAEGLEVKHELYLGVRKNEHVEIRSKHFLSDMIFDWCAPEYLRINEDLRQDALKNQHGWLGKASLNGKTVMSQVLPKILNY